MKIGLGGRLGPSKPLPATAAAYRGRESGLRVPGPSGGREHGTVPAMSDQRISDPHTVALTRMTQNILRANGYDVEPIDPAVWCGTCREHSVRWQQAWYRYSANLRGFLSWQDRWRYRSPVPGRDPEAVRMIVERKRLGR